MNNKQRIVLGIGAAAFMYVLFTSPKISIVKGTYVIPPPDKKEIAKIVDVSTAMTRAVAVLGATLLVYVALKDKKGTRIQSTMDRNPIVGGCQESEREPVRKDVVAKIVRFLKDFF
ncbi:MAG: hypothetical protein Q7V12_03210 [Deltaproteobacteria bacterium]|nr:hypothetical protein [Deltaproteobacteria bacterium]